MRTRRSRRGEGSVRAWITAVGLSMAALLTACSQASAPPASAATAGAAGPSSVTRTAMPSAASPSSTALSAVAARPLQDCIAGWESTSVQETILATIPPDRTGQLVAMAAQLSPDLVYLERLHCGEVGALALRDPAGSADCALATAKLTGFRDAASRGSLSAATAVREIETYARALCR